MKSLATESLNYFNKLQKAGVPSEQAHVHAEVLAAFMERVVTKEELKQELEGVKISLRQEIKQEITEIHHALKNLELRMTVKLGAMLVVAMGLFTTVIAAIIKFL